MKHDNRAKQRKIEIAREHIKRVEEDNRVKAAELKKAARYVARVEAGIRAKEAELEKASKRIKKLENELIVRDSKHPGHYYQAPQAPTQGYQRLPVNHDISITTGSLIGKKFQYYLKSEGFISTLKRFAFPDMRLSWFQIRIF